MINYRIMVAVFAVAVVIVGLAHSIELQWKWAITGGAMIAGLFFSSYEAPDGARRRVFLGVLVDSRNKLSSSHLLVRRVDNSDFVGVLCRCFLEPCDKRGKCARRCRSGRDLGIARNQQGLAGWIANPQGTQGNGGTAWHQPRRVSRSQVRFPVVDVET